MRKLSGTKNRKSKIENPLARSSQYENNLITFLELEIWILRFETIYLVLGIWVLEFGEWVGQTVLCDKILPNSK